MKSNVSKHVLTIAMWLAITFLSALPAWSLDLGVGGFPDITVLPSGNYVVTYLIDGSNVGLLEYDSTSTLLNQYSILNASDAGTIDIGSPKVLPSATNTYIAAARGWFSPLNNRGYVYTERQFGQSAPLVPPTYVNEIGWSYGSGGIALSGDGSKLFSVSHVESNSWDVYFYYLDKNSGNHISSGFLSTARANRQFTPKTLALANGSAFISVWCDNSNQFGDTSGYAVMARVWDPINGFWGTEFLVNQTTIGNQGTGPLSPQGLPGGVLERNTYSIKPIGTNRVLITYLSTGSGPTVDMYGRIYEYDASARTVTAVTNEIPFGDFVAGNELHLTAVSLANHSVLVAYTQEVNGVTSIITNVIDENANFLQGDFTIAQNVGEYSYPSVSQVNATTSLVVWAENVSFDIANYNSSLKGSIMKMSQFAIGTDNADSLSYALLSAPFQFASRQSFPPRLSSVTAKPLPASIYGVSWAPALSPSGLSQPLPMMSLVKGRPGGGGGSSTSTLGITASLLAGNDTFTGTPQDDFIDGGPGQDTIDGGPGLDTAYYGSRPQSVQVTLNGSSPVTVYIGGIAEDTLSNVENIIGGDAADILTGDAQPNVFEGGPGADQLNGSGGSDTTSYARALSAVTANLASSTNNTGDAADDTYTSIENLTGSQFNDTLTGDSNPNTIIGGKGSDTMTGGAKSDTFAYNSVSDSPAKDGARDTITDFSVGGGHAHKDIIDLSAIDANTESPGGQSFSFIGTNAFTNTPGQLRVYSSNGNTTVSGDVNGDGVADIEITLQGISNASNIQQAHFKL